jgi:hypothetical protein
MDPSSVGQRHLRPAPTVSMRRRREEREMQRE